jgi:hypothetical protein
MIARGEGQEKRIKRCDELETKCLDYCKAKKYDVDMILY